MSDALAALGALRDEPAHIAEWVTSKPWLHHAWAMGAIADMVDYAREAGFAEIEVGPYQFRANTYIDNNQGGARLQVHLMEARMVSRGNDKSYTLTIQIPEAAVTAVVAALRAKTPDGQTESDR